MSTALPLFHRTYGNEHAQRLLLLNPLGGSSQIWKSFVEPLSARYEVMQIEYPGFGGSPFTPVESVERLSERVRSTLREVEPKPLHVIGYSFGAWVAQHLAAANDAPVRSLTLIGASDRIYAMGVHLVGEWIRVLDQIGLDAMLVQMALWSFSPATFEQMPQVVPYFTRSSRSGCADPNVYRDQLEATRQYQQSAALERIQVPSLVLRGELDITCPKFHSDLLATQLPQGRQIELPGAGHAALWEAPKAALEAIQTFLGGHAV